MSTNASREEGGCTGWFNYNQKMKPQQNALAGGSHLLKYDELDKKTSAFFNFRDNCNVIQRPFYRVGIRESFCVFQPLDHGIFYISIARTRNVLVCIRNSWIHYLCIDLRESYNKDNICK